MQIFLNGELQTISETNLLQLVQRLNLEGKRFAVEHNQQIVPKSKLESIAISDQDKIEIIHAVGGG